jgi:DNA-binding Lrp family transcriptional regulator
MVLKPQDVVVLIKLFAYREPRPSYAQIGIDLGMSPSEVHAAVKRLRASQLVRAALPMRSPALPRRAKSKLSPPAGLAEMIERPNVEAAEEFLIHGLKYVFPAKRGEMTRGVPTSYAAEPLKRFIQATDEPVPVWPHAEGTVRGMALEPLYPSVSEAAMRDPYLYEVLALIDALRDGRARERKIAEAELIRRLRGK